MHKNQMKYKVDNVIVPIIKFYLWFTEPFVLIFLAQHIFLCYFTTSAAYLLIFYKQFKADVTLESDKLYFIDTFIQWFDKMMWNISFVLIIMLDIYLCNYALDANDKET